MLTHNGVETRLETGVERLAAEADAERAARLAREKQRREKLARESSPEYRAEQEHRRACIARAGSEAGAAWAASTATLQDLRELARFYQQGPQMKNVGDVVAAASDMALSYPPELRGIREQDQYAAAAIGGAARWFFEHHSEITGRR